MTTETPPTPPTQPLQFTCRSCGSQMTYEAGTTEMRCTACGAEQQIADDGHTIVEHSYDQWASLPPKPVALIAKQVLRCQGCGATTETDMVADVCQFCGGTLVGMQSPEGLISPEAVVPFGLAKSAANEAFGKWVRSRRFAPGALKKVGSTEAIKGTYVPHWTFDAETQTDYTGQRGEHYYTTESYQVSDSNGQSHTETREVQHTRWWPASGHVSRAFDDLVVPASNLLPTERLDKMGPWELGQAKAYEPEYLAGYSAVRYDVDPAAGLAVAHEEMEGVIRNDCLHDIGGDEQRVSSMNVGYASTMFKLLLLPLWIASYLYAGKTYQVLVNANTGQVIGDRPYSKMKIFLTILLAVVIIAAAIGIYLATRAHGSS